MAKYIGKSVVSMVQVEFQCGIERVWDTVTSLTEYSWRSDLDRIEILSENKFVEYSKDGFATTFTVTVNERCRRWEFDLDNANISGHWTGVFTQNGGKTVIEFTEDVTAKKLIMKPLVRGFLKKQQARYIEDLKKALGEQNDGRS